MARMTVTIQGERTLARRLSQMSDAMAGNTLMTAVKAAAQPIRNSAAQRAPYRTGNLRRSLTVEEAEKSRSKAFVDVGTNVEYAPFVEFGTRRMSARPYLRPAVDEGREQFKRSAVSLLRQLLQRAIS